MWKDAIMDLKLSPFSPLLHLQQLLYETVDLVKHVRTHHSLMINISTFHQLPSQTKLLHLFDFFESCDPRLLQRLISSSDQLAE